MSDTELEEPPVGAAHLTPRVWLESAVKTCPSVPTARLSAAADALPTTRSPLAVINVAGKVALKYVKSSLVRTC